MNDKLKSLIGKPKNNLWNNFGSEKIDTDVDPNKFNIRRKSSAHVSLVAPKTTERVGSEKKFLRRQSFVKSSSFLKPSEDGRLELK